MRLALSSSSSSSSIGTTSTTSSILPLIPRNAIASFITSIATLLGTNRWNSRRLVTASAATHRNGSTQSSMGKKSKRKDRGQQKQTAQTPAERTSRDVTGAARVNPFSLPKLESAPFLTHPHDFDRNLFSCTIAVPSLDVDCKLCHRVLTACGGFLLNAPKIPPVVKPKEGADPAIRTVLFSPLKPLDELKALATDALADLGLTAIEFGTQPVSVGYDYWSAEEILKAALPTDFDVVTSSFETVGHLAHMNLRDHQLPFKHFIGQVILDKNKHVRTVVNKLSNIDTTYRFFQMELLAGDDDFNCEVKENGCIFRFDFSRVYWNSRLHTEHARIIKTVAQKKQQPHQQDERAGHPVCLCDMMAGVGPFALPLGKRGVRVYANDLNPLSFEALVNNIKINKVDDAVTPFNMDGRAFVREITAKILAEAQSGAIARKWPAFTDVTMNLPASSVSFLDVFHGLFKDDEQRLLPLPTIHLHCFSTEDDMEVDVVRRAQITMGGVLDQPYAFRVVRNVAPHKHMVCLSFTLPAAVAYGHASLHPPAPVPTTVSVSQPQLSGKRSSAATNSEIEGESARPPATAITMNQGEGEAKHETSVAKKPHLSS